MRLPAGTSFAFQTYTLSNPSRILIQVHQCNHHTAVPSAIFFGYTNRNILMGIVTNIIPVGLAVVKAGSQTI